MAPPRAAFQNGFSERHRKRNIIALIDLRARSERIGWRQRVTAASRPALDNPGGDFVTLDSSAMVEKKAGLLPAGASFFYLASFLTPVQSVKGSPPPLSELHEACAGA